MLRSLLSLCGLRMRAPFAGRFGMSVAIKVAVRIRKCGEGATVVRVRNPTAEDAYGSDESSVRTTAQGAGFR